MGMISRVIFAIYVSFALLSAYAVVDITTSNSDVIETGVSFSTYITDIEVSHDVVYYPNGNVSYTNFTVTAVLAFDASRVPLDVKVYDISYSANVFFINEDGQGGMKSVGSFHFYDMNDPIVVSSGSTVIYTTTINITEPYFRDVLNSTYHLPSGSRYWILAGGLNYQIAGFENLPKNSLGLWRDHLDEGAMK